MEVYNILTYSWSKLRSGIMCVVLGCDIIRLYKVPFGAQARICAHVCVCVWKVAKESAKALGIVYSIFHCEEAVSLNAHD